jgi:hypothetical protein
MSTLVRLVGVCSLVGGADPSDRPEDPAVDGRPSKESFLATDFFRAGAPSGQVHCRPLSAGHFMESIAKARTSRWPCVQRMQFGFDSSHCTRSSVRTRPKTTT